MTRTARHSCFRRLLAKTDSQVSNLLTCQEVDSRTVPRVTGEETRSAIKEAALDAFAARGADVPLDEVARTLGITRAAILHHYGSKAALWQEIVAELRATLDGLLGDYQDTATPLLGKAREQFLTRLVETYCDHRKVVLLVLRNVAGNWPEVEAQVARLAGLLVDANPTPIERVIVDSVLGVIVRPVVDPFVDVDDPQTRALLATLAAQVAAQLDGARAERAAGAPVGR